MKSKPITETQSVAKPTAILGTYEGECADAKITNKNGLDITRPVWENVFASEDYAQAIDLGWYIGFLGHPEDPGCMDFEHGCIVMTEGHIDDDGKVYGKFNLIDTPVGRVVKAFQDAGVTFGISVRGAGDIVDNSVDPDTFVFRGFDLVTFPAFPESIPTFSAIAASSDLDKQKKYQKVCSSIRDNLSNITSASTIEVLKSQFAKQSEEYAILSARQLELSSEENSDLLKTQLECVTELYSAEVKANEELKIKLKKAESATKMAALKASRKVKSIKNISKKQCEDIIQANDARIDKLKHDLSRATNTNLKYKQKIDSATADAEDKDAVIASLRRELAETVNKLHREETRTSNLGEANKTLKSKVSAAEKIVSEYQWAYALLYSNATGITFDLSKVSASTSVKEMKAILGSAASVNTSVDVPSIEDTDFDVVDGDANLITL